MQVQRYFIDIFFDAFSIPSSCAPVNAWEYLMVHTYNTGDSTHTHTYNCIYHVCSSRDDRIICISYKVVGLSSFFLFFSFPLLFLFRLLFFRLRRVVFIFPLFFRLRTRACACEWVLLYIHIYVHLCTGTLVVCDLTTVTRKILPYLRRIRAYNIIRTRVSECVCVCVCLYTRVCVFALGSTSVAG
jgi:hypothetical protein